MVYIMVLAHTVSKDTVCLRSFCPPKSPDSFVCRISVYQAQNAVYCRLSSNIDGRTVYVHLFAHLIITNEYFVITKSNLSPLVGENRELHFKYCVVFDGLCPVRDNKSVISESFSTIMVLISIIKTYQSSQHHLSYWGWMTWLSHISF